MTIEKGRPWGNPGALADDGVIVHDDAELRQIVEDARSSSRALPMIGLLGGDLCRTVGGRGDEARLRSGEAMRLPVDIVSVEVGGDRYWFVSHAVLRHPWWHGRIVAVMNAQWIGAWDVAPRSHPNDGVIEVFDADLTLDDKLKARRRLLTGTHVPHPSIEQRRVAEGELTLGRPTSLYLDGTRIGKVSDLRFTVEPSALTCVV